MDPGWIRTLTSVLEDHLGTEPENGALAVQRLVARPIG